MPCKPVKLELGLVGLVTEPPAPERMDQEPVPIDGGLAPSVVEEAQSVWSAPATAVVGPGVYVMTTSSVEDAQGALETVQRSV